jgi:putative transposase
MLVARFGVSLRRACRVAGQSRSTQARAARTPVAKDEVLRARLRQIAAEHPRWGWRKAHAIARAEGVVVNAKRTHRLWQLEGLQRRARARKKRRLGPSAGQRWCEALHPDHVWALDYQHDTTSTGRQIRFLNVIDEYTREALATRAAWSWNADQTTALLDELITTLGRKPEHLRMDNGPELTSHALSDWARFGSVGCVFIEPGAPWQNGICESFNGRFRDEFLAAEAFGSLTEAQVLSEDWRTEYNTYRPHSSLGGQAPSNYRKQWERNHQQLS